MAAISFDLYAAEIMAILLIFSVAVLSVGFTLLEKWATGHEHSHFLYILLRASRELALLGLVSLLLFVIEQADAIKNHVAEGRLQFLHIGLFGIASTFLLYVTFLLLSSNFIIHEWQQLERYHDFSRYKELKLQLHQQQLLLCLPTDVVASTVTHLPEPPALRPLLHAFFRHPSATLNYYRNLHTLRFLEQRQRFLLCHANSIPRDFSFAAYLEVCLHHVYAKLVSIPDALWAALAVLITLDLYIRIIWDWYRNEVKSYIVVAALSFLIIIVAAADVWHIQNVNWAILHSEYARMQVPLNSIMAHSDWEALMREVSMTRGQAAPPTWVSSLDAPLDADTEAVRSSSVAADGRPIVSAPRALLPVESSIGAAGPALTVTDFDIVRGVSLDPRILAPPQPRRRSAAPTLRVLQSESGGVPAVERMTDVVLALPTGAEKGEEPSSMALRFTAAVAGSGGGSREHRPRLPSDWLSKSRTAMQAQKQPQQPLGQPEIPQQPQQQQQSLQPIQEDRNQLQQQQQHFDGLPARGIGYISTIHSTGSKSASPVASTPSPVPTPPPDDAVQSSPLHSASDHRAVVLSSPLHSAPPPSIRASTTTATTTQLQKEAGQMQQQREAKQGAAGVCAVTVPSGVLGSNMPTPEWMGAAASAPSAPSVAASTATTPYSPYSPSSSYAQLHFRHVERQRKLFWCAMPVLVLRAIQVVFICAALAVGVIIVDFSDIVSNTNRVLWTFITLPIACIISVVLLVKVVPLYVTSIHVSDLVDARVLKEALALHDRLALRAQLKKATTTAAAAANTAALSGQRAKPTFSSSSWLRSLALCCDAKARRAARSPLHLYIPLCAFVVEFFLLTILSSSLLAGPGRTVAYAFAIGAVGVATFSLLASPHNGECEWNGCCCACVGQRGCRLKRPCVLLDAAALILAIAAVVIASALDDFSLSFAEKGNSILATGMPLLAFGATLLCLGSNALVRLHPPPTAVTSPSHGTRRSPIAHRAAPHPMSLSPSLSVGGFGGTRSEGLLPHPSGGVVRHSSFDFGPAGTVRWRR